MVYLESKSTDPHFNLALEQYVFDELPREQDYCMLWQNDNAIIVGKYQNTAEEVNGRYVAEQGIRVVRRLSGGGAVYHDLGNLNFTFIRDADKEEMLDFESFCLPVAGALAAYGVKAELSGRNDITIDGKKFSGNAQYIREGRVMHHGTILFDSDLSVLAKALNAPRDKIESKGVKSTRSRVTNVKEYLSADVGLRAFWDSLAAHIDEQVGLVPLALGEGDLARVRAIQRERYDTWEWNWGASPRYAVHKHRRIEGVGGVSVEMDVQEGVVTAFALSGDFFSSADTGGLVAWMQGRRLNREELAAALRTFDVGRYINNLTAEEFVRLLLE